MYVFSYPNEDPIGFVPDHFPGPEGTFRFHHSSSELLLAVSAYAMTFFATSWPIVLPSTNCEVSCPAICVNCCSSSAAIEAKFSANKYDNTSAAAPATIAPSDGLLLSVLLL